ncbi:UbiA family prenyltransferase [Pseudoduganella namucuonensis]|uniref:4-hydroxybenzoate polyprenyltransferase n=1 Tax=Pseudoduganella namucuonensis TaxID=1035707 RepID=A0A1I7GF80_9BURK|nr:UbiA family prenyltransferase [Pseudoduganella namucuonensis]SFU47068.1 4-hydroxybenzoate polyprenyltransferase [Pseudoduganella namucuonensis]
MNIAHDTSSANVPRPAARRPPLVIDLDGTLTYTDTLVESVVRLLKGTPWRIFTLLLALFGGRAGFKRHVAGQMCIAPDTLPYNEELLDYARAERDAGRRVILATAAHSSIADPVAAHLGLFEQVIATGQDGNLKGAAKLARIRAMVGDDFVYAGDSPADLAIWRGARAAILVGVSPGLERQARAVCEVERVFPARRAGPMTWLRAIRVHQWLKNLLIFVPLLTAFTFLEMDKLVSAGMAFFAFSFAASATYLWNDLVDLESDRRHPRKRHRPMASGEIAIPKALLAALLLMAAGLLLGALVSGAFLASLVAYIVLTTAYSLVLKRYVLIDVLMLAVLYTLRIFTGSIAVHVEISAWLLAFSLLIFYSLAILKRCAELVSLRDASRQAASGRDYLVSDLIVLWPLGVGAALASIVVFCLYVQAPDTQVRYLTPALLWGVFLCLLYWLSRLWVKTARAEMHDDPLVYAIKDRGCRLTIGAMVAFTIAARFIAVPH